MSSECRPRDCYDLCTRPIIKVRRVRVEESQDEMEARTKENERSRSLAEISNTLREVLNKNDILVSGINLGTHRLLQAADDTASLALRTRPLASGPGRPNTDFDEAVIRSRLVSATYLAEVLVDSLKQINEAILQSSINSARPSQKPTVEEPTVFYRVCLKNSYTSHNVDLGFWSARGLPDHDFHKPSDYEFQTHTGGHHHLADPDDKCGGITFNSPYISLTTDPGRAFNIGQRNKRNRLGGLHHEVYHIDAAKLRKMKIVTERTTDLATQWDIPYLGSGADRLEYVTDSHWLARFWIPAECIIGKIPFSDFEELCTEHGVVNSMYQLSLNKAEILTMEKGMLILQLGESFYPLMLLRRIPTLLYQWKLYTIATTSPR